MTDTKQLFVDAGQSQLFQNWDSLPRKDQEELLSNLKQISSTRAPTRLLEDCQNAIKFSQTNSSSDIAVDVKPLPSTSYESLIGNSSKENEYWQAGMEAIGKGEVAVILMAGGQGTRLGSSQPKGCYDIGLPSKKSLFQIQAEKLIRLQDMIEDKKVEIPWYIMTSGPTRAATEAYFQKHDYFGLNGGQITFFNQGALPAFDLNGEHFLMKDPVSLSQSPDGNGGLYRAIKENRLNEDFDRRGIKHVYMYCVDNVLSKMADPVFIGFAIKHGFELATKAVRKRDAHESVGLIATKNNKPCVIEYSEISNELAEAKDEEGLLKLRAANIVNHYYLVDLLKRDLDQWCENMPYHIAKKKIPAYNSLTGKYTKPTEPNGIKLEQFIFDVFDTVPLSKFGCLEVDRSKEFSPLKNGSGSKNDNAETSRLAYLSLGTSWLKNAGAVIKDGVLVEVSNKLSYAGENLGQFKGQIFDKNGIILEK
ncbi:qri1p [Saccharomyces arboricola H-6]|uniref:UDP-N-acetylglucosamine diphosphorylase n=1 Tax=Saccharomyces arboricola (strain H-6 / AS 2.3317 / CBS 10644) TaxID=1160507 RepID=J8Q9T2_SACAR|nr:qri1p [Saccharomyces arboricola H-6]